MTGSLVIRSSYAFGNVITARASVGGLVGLYNHNAPLPNTCEITGSYAALRLTANNSVGGILGTVWGGTCRLTASYSASVPKGTAGKSDIGGLRGSLFVGSANNIHGNVSVNATYWDATLAGDTPVSDDDVHGRTTEQLQEETEFSGIYAIWNNYFCDAGSGVPGDSLAWDPSDANAYPLLTCPPGGVARQRELFARFRDGLNE